MNHKIYGPNFFTLSFISFIPSLFLFWVAFYVAKFSGQLDFLIFCSFPFLWLLFGLTFLSAKVQIDNDGIEIGAAFWGRPRVVKWKNITGIEYWKTPWTGDVIRILEGQSPQKAVAGINGIFSNHRQIIREIVAKAPEGAKVDPRLYTKELDKSDTLVAIGWMIGAVLTLYTCQYLFGWFK